MEAVFMCLAYLLLIADRGQCQACNSKRAFLCTDGTCISNVNVCDGNPDCQGGQDEGNCDVMKCGQSAVDVDKTKPSGARIVGGENSAVGSWPWQVLITRYTLRKQGQTPLTFHERYLVGGGSLLNKKWILTAAHLFGVKDSARITPSRYAASLGVNKRPSGGNRVESFVQMFLAAEVHLHPNFSMSTIQNDMALIKLGSKLNSLTMRRIPNTHTGASFSYYVRPVCLPCTGLCLTPDKIVDKHGNSLLRDEMSNEDKCVVEENVLLPSDEEVIVSGFGYSSKYDPYGRRVKPTVPRKLQHARLSVVDTYKCWRSITDINRLMGTRLVFTEEMICCDSRNSKKVADACQGDSGGPLVKKVTNSVTGESCWIQVGIVSFGYGCAMDYPGFYTNVARFVPWINSTISSA